MGKKRKRELMRQTTMRRLSYARATPALSRYFGLATLIATIHTSKYLRVR